MAEINCGACEELRQTSPEFIVNGLTDDICSSLANDTGLSPSDDHNDCTDLHNLNDCLVGNMEREVDAYDVCDWKEFMKNFIPNLWTTLKAMICALCGIWTNIHSIWTKVNCVYDALSTLTNGIANSVGGVTFVRYYRDLGTSGSSVPFWENLSAGFTRTLDIYMNSGGASSGNQAADRDYVVMISNCTNYHGFEDLAGYVTYYSSGDTRSIAAIRDSQGQHPNIKMPNGQAMNTFSWTTSGAVLLKKGEHIKVNFYVGSADQGSAAGSDNPAARLHQFVLVWIPVNVSEALDPSDILKC